VKVLALSAEEWQTAKPQAISFAVALIMLVMVESKKLSTKVLTNPEVSGIIETKIRS
jgi:hypothetical protein